MRIVLIKLHLLGDVIQALHVLRALRRQYPHAEITFVSETGYAFALSHLQPDAQPDAVMLWRQGRVVGDVSASAIFDTLEGLLQALTHRGPFDLVVNLSPDQEAVALASSLATRARAGSFFSPSAGRLVLGPYGLANAAAVVFRQLARLNVVDMFSLNAGVDAPGDLPIWDTDVLRARAGEIAREAGLPQGAFVCLQPGSSVVERRWDASNFSRVGDAIGQAGRHVVIVGAPHEAPLCAEVAAGMRQPATSLTNLDLNDLRALLAAAEFLVTNDTGPMHLASAAGIRTVAASVGHSSPIDTGAYRSGAEAVMSTLPCAPCAEPKACTIDRQCFRDVQAEAIATLALKGVSFAGIHAYRATRDPVSGVLEQGAVEGSLLAPHEVLRRWIADHWTRTVCPQLAFSTTPERTLVEMSPASWDSAKELLSRTGIEAGQMLDAVRGGRASVVDRSSPMASVVPVLAALPKLSEVCADATVRDPAAITLSWLSRLRDGAASA